MVLDSSAKFQWSLPYEKNEYAYDIYKSGRCLLNICTSDEKPKYNHEAYVDWFFMIYERIKRNINFNYHVYYLESFCYNATRESMSLRENADYEKDLKHIKGRLNKTIMYYYMGYLQDDPVMIFKLSRLVNREESFGYVNKAAELGLDRAQNVVAYHYQKGKKFKKDDTMAFYWYMKSAKQNNPVAQYHVGMMYMEGRGIHRDLKLADFWLNKAAKQNYFGKEENQDSYY